VERLPKRRSTSRSPARILTGPLRPRAGEGNRSPRIPGCAPAARRAHVRIPLLSSDRPAVGKDLARALDRAALGRKFVRISLGRHSRRGGDFAVTGAPTSAAMPGRLISALKRRHHNPFCCSTEVDKVGADNRATVGASSRFSTLGKATEKAESHLRDHYLACRFRSVEGGLIATANHPETKSLHRCAIDELSVSRLLRIRELVIAERYIIPKPDHRGRPNRQLESSSAASHPYGSSALHPRFGAAGAGSPHAHLGANIARRVVRRRAGERKRGDRRAESARADDRIERSPPFLGGRATCRRNATSSPRSALQRPVWTPYGASAACASADDGRQGSLILTASWAT